jgi:hypothetical protein
MERRVVGNEIVNHRQLSKRHFMRM